MISINQMRKKWIKIFTRKKKQFSGWQTEKSNDEIFSQTLFGENEDKREPIEIDLLRIVTKQVYDDLSRSFEMKKSKLWEMEGELKLNFYSWIHSRLDIKFLRIRVELNVISVMKYQTTDFDLEYIGKLFDISKLKVRNVMFNSVVFYQSYHSMLPSIR